jgi:hypothetical protein
MGNNYGEKEVIRWGVYSMTIILKASSI